MIALNAGIQYVVCLQWLIDSAAAKMAQPIDISSEDGEGVGYLVCDEDKQRRYGFDMRDTLARAKQSQQAECTHKVFANLAIYCTPGVCGLTAPTERDMANIIESGGGVWLGD